ncbi:MAG: alpha/beta fold hydrolase [Austwickia sp.]|nr:alpha/beta fold hydrolase [Austwickia sp.]MBK8435500.1 alpha/beta fold hydrolase [Austwickia sp.]MBK9100928.1 alpha/beta fold hydrolase [Austwickia sp.]
MLLAGGLTGALLTASAVGTAGFLSYLARLLLLPDRDHVDDVRIRHIGQEWITLSVTPDSVRPGRYGLWFPGGHLRVGEVLDASSTSVRRVLERIDAGTPQPGPARWNGWYYARDPRADLGVDYQDIVVRSDVGDLPVWLIEPDGSVGGRDRWAVLIHGRGGERPECLRAVPVLRRLGMTCVIPSYRNDVGAPPSPDGRYNLGLSEWRDVEACVRHALAHGADDVVLVGWSMGGAAALQMLDCSGLADAVSAVVLDSPVVDWGHVIRHQAEVLGLPPLVARSVTDLIGRRWARRLVGVHQPLDVARTNWEVRAAELRHPLLIMHSDGDDLVPGDPALALSRARPDLVRWERWITARHTQEWNTDPARWEAAVADFLS